MSRIFVTTAEVAALLDMSGATFLRARQRLEQDDGFPCPMPHSRRPLRWRADQISAWIDANGLPIEIEDSIDPALIKAGRVVLMAEARRP